MLGNKATCGACLSYWMLIGHCVDKMTYAASHGFTCGDCATAIALPCLHLQVRSQPSQSQAIPARSRQGEPTASSSSWTHAPEKGVLFSGSSRHRPKQKETAF